MNSTRVFTEPNFEKTSTFVGKCWVYANIETEALCSQSSEEESGDIKVSQTDTIPRAIL